MFLPSPSEARARQQSPKIRILKIGGTFWTKSEPISPKILTLTFDCRPTGDNPAQRFRPPPLCFGEQNRKIFLTFFNCAPPKFFQLRKRKFFCFAFLLTQELRKRFPTPSPPSAGRAGGQKFLPPNPFLFARLLGLRPDFFRRKFIYGFLTSFINSSIDDSNSCGVYSPLLVFSG